MMQDNSISVNQNLVSKQQNDAVTNTNVRRTTAPFMSSTISTRPTSTSGADKSISLVPDQEPWLSPRIDYSQNVYLTSNHEDFDPQVILQRLQRNKLVHKTFDTHLVTQ